MPEGRREEGLQPPVCGPAPGDVSKVGERREALELESLRRELQERGHLRMQLAWEECRAQHEDWCGSSPFCKPHLCWNARHGVNIPCER